MKKAVPLPRPLFHLQSICAFLRIAKMLHFLAFRIPDGKPLRTLPGNASADEGAFDDELSRLAVGAFREARLFEQVLGILQHCG